MVQVVPSTNTTQVRARTTGTPSSIAVGSPQIYCEYSRDWAVKMDGMVEGVDYSSKYYANQAHEYADSILTDAGFIAVTESLTSINAVANDLENIDAVLLNVGSINTVSNYVTQIDTIDDYVSDINTCSTNIADINTCANEITSITSKVNKSGDTMTGGLEAPTIKAYSVTAGSIVAKNNETNGLGSITLQPIGVSGSNLAGRIYFLDSNSSATGFPGSIESMRYSAYTAMRLSSYGMSSGSIQGGYIEICYNPSTQTDFIQASSGIKKDITHWSSPSNNQASNVQYITLQASGTGYTAPFDGWFVMMFQCSTAGSITIHNASINASYAVMVHNVWGGDWSSGQIEVSKGDVIVFSYPADMQFTGGAIFWLRRNGN